MARGGVSGTSITRTILMVVGFVISIALLVQLSPTIIENLMKLGDQMVSDGNTYNNTLLVTLGTVTKDYSPVIYYGGIVGAVFVGVYALGRRLAGKTW